MSYLADRKEAQASATRLIISHSEFRWHRMTLCNENRLRFPVKELAGSRIDEKNQAETEKEKLS